MTERWRKKLGDLDKTGPSEDVFERAKEGPTHPDEALVGPKMSTRVGTVVVAFAVFALAISAFAIPALRMGGDQAAAGGGLFPVWPAQSPDQLQQLQADADAGSAAWALSPEGVVQQFSHQVMGWTDAVVSDAAVVGCSANYPTGVVMSGPPTPGISCVGIGYPTAASVYDGPPGSLAPDRYAASSSGGASTGGFRQFLILESDSIGYKTPFQEVVVVYQPLEQGDGQIWAVVEARSPNIEVPLSWGQTVHDGASISAGFNTNLEPTLGYTACDQSVASSLFHSPGGAGKGIEMMASFPASASCSGQLPGYVWATASPRSLAAPDGGVLVDPLVGPPPAGLAGLTAEPIVAVFSDTGAIQTVGPTSTETASDLPLTWTTYTDPLGWSVDVPPGWTTQHYAGAGAGFSGDGLSVSVTRGGVNADDSSFPLDPDGFFIQGEGGLIGSLNGDGLPYKFVVTQEGTTLTKLDAVQKPIIDRMIRSISFQQWSSGEERNGYTAVGVALPAATAEWITYKGDHYVTYYGGDGGRALLGPAPSCGAGATYEIRMTGEAGISCADGTTANWSFSTGDPASANQAPFDRSLAKYPAVLGWDGSLLVQFPQGQNGG